MSLASPRQCPWQQHVHAAPPFYPVPSQLFSRVRLRESHLFVMFFSLWNASACQSTSVHVARMGQHVFLMPVAYVGKSLHLAQLMALVFHSLAFVQRLAIRVVVVGVRTSCHLRFNRGRKERTIPAWCQRRRTHLCTRARQNIRLCHATWKTFVAANGCAWPYTVSNFQDCATPADAPRELSPCINAICRLSRSEQVSRSLMPIAKHGGACFLAYVP